MSNFARLSLFVNADAVVRKACTRQPDGGSQAPLCVKSQGWLFLLLRKVRRGTPDIPPADRLD